MEYAALCRLPGSIYKGISLLKHHSTNLIYNRVNNHVIVQISYYNHFGILQDVGYMQTLCITTSLFFFCKSKAVLKKGKGTVPLNRMSSVRAFSFISFEHRKQNLYISHI